MAERIIEKNILELERRVKRLEKEFSKASYCYYSKQKNSQTSAMNHNFSFTLNVHEFTYLKLKLTIRATASVIDLILKINGASAVERKQVSGDYQLECVLPFAKGISTVTVELKSESSFAVNDCHFETQGNLSYVDEEYLLQVANESDRSIILTLIDECAVISEYKSSQMQRKFALNSVKSASLCRLGGNYLLAIVNDEYKCKVILFNDKIQKIGEQVLGEKVISVCSLGGENAKIFAVKGNSIYQYAVKSDLTFSFSATGLNGKKVKSNPDVNDYIIVVDYNGNAKLVQI